MCGGSKKLQMVTKPDGSQYEVWEGLDSDDSYDEIMEEALNAPGGDERQMVRGPSL